LNKFAGPSIWFEGAIKGYSERPARNGGGNRPQNSNVFPTSGIRRMAIILVDTASERFTTDPVQLSAIRKLWKDAAQEGLLVAGKLQSTAHYYTAGAPVDQTVTLNPIALGAPPGGRSSGIEVRITDGWNLLP
jgi:hypothetical protein